MIKLTLVYNPSQGSLSETTTIFVDPQTIVVFHDTIWEGVANLFTIHGAFAILKDEACVDMFNKYIKPSFVKCYTRFDPTNNPNALWDKNKRYLLYCNPSNNLPYICENDKVTMFFGEYAFTIENQNHPKWKS